MVFVMRAQRWKKNITKLTGKNVSLNLKVLEKYRSRNGSYDCIVQARRQRPSFKRRY